MSKEGKKIRQTQEQIEYDLADGLDAPRLGDGEASTVLPGIVGGQQDLAADMKIRVKPTKEDRLYDLKQKLAESAKDGVTSFGQLPRTTNKDLDYILKKKDLETLRGAQVWYQANFSSGTLAGKKLFQRLDVFGTVAAQEQLVKDKLAIMEKMAMLLIYGPGSKKTGLTVKQELVLLMKIDKLLGEQGKSDEAKRRFLANLNPLHALWGLKSTGDQEEIYRRGIFSPRVDYASVLKLLG